MTLDIGSELPQVEVVDVRGSPGTTTDLATTGLPVLIVTSAMSRMCRSLEEVYLEVAKLDEGDYNVWAFVQGPPGLVRAAYARVGERIRLFPFEPSWPGLDAFHVTRYPTLVYSGVGNEVRGMVEGWDRVEWQQAINDLRALHLWQPVFLRRTLPAPAATLVGRRDEAASVVSG